MPVRHKARPPFVVRLWLAVQILRGATYASRFYAPLRSDWELQIRETGRNIRR